MRSNSCCGVRIPWAIVGLYSSLGRIRVGFWPTGATQVMSVDSSMRIFNCGTGVVARGDV